MQSHELHSLTTRRAWQQMETGAIAFELASLFYRTCRLHRPQVSLRSHVQDPVGHDGRAIGRRAEVMLASSFVFLPAASTSRLFFVPR